MGVMQRVEKYIFWFAIAFIVYMPLHIFISQSASLLTGGLDVWKAAKDVLLVISVPFLLYVSYRRGFFKEPFFRRFIILAGLYALLHVFFLLFSNDFTGWYAAIIASVYNVRIFGFFLLGYIVGKSQQRSKYIKVLVTAAVLISFVVALFGIAQYFLPKDMLESVGYSVERGVKPMFFIDDKPDLPRVMSTIRDPNKLGAYLIVPMLLVITALLKKQWNRELFTRPFKKHVLGVFLLTYSVCMFLSFSRGAVLSLFFALGVYVVLLYGRQSLKLLRRFWWIGIVAILLSVATIYAARDTYLFKNIVFHADEATTKADPNEKRLILYEEAIDNITEQPLGYGPGSAGIVSVKSDSGQILTENYFLQVLHETGIAGLILFGSLLALVAMQLLRYAREPLALVLFASFAGYVFYSLLVHLWSNEAVALQWWLLAGACVAYLAKKNKTS
jgi:hypothetical protein